MMVVSLGIFLDCLWPIGYRSQKELEAACITIIHLLIVFYDGKMLNLKSSNTF